MLEKLIQMLEENPTAFLETFPSYKLTEINGVIDASGNTFLHRAAALGNLDVVTFLVKQGLEVNALNKFNDTPLCGAIKNQHSHIVRFLLDKGAKTNTMNKYGMAPIHFAACCPEPEPLILSLIIQAQCSLELGTQETNATPLLLAVSKKLSKNVDTLLQHGADVNAKNSHNVSSIKLALEREDPQTLSSLLFWGAELPQTAVNEPKLQSIIDIYRKLRNELSILKTLILWNNVCDNSKSFPSLLQITGLTITQQRDKFCLNKIPDILQTYLNHGFPKNLKAGFFKPDDKHQSTFNTEQEQAPNNIPTSKNVGMSS